MKLQDALLCVDCDNIVDASDPACPSCTSTVLFPLSRVIQPRADRREIDVTRLVHKAYFEYNPLTGIPKE